MPEKRAIEPWLELVINCLENVPRLVQGERRFGIERATAHPAEFVDAYHVLAVVARFAPRGIASIDDLSRQVIDEEIRKPVRDLDE